MIVKKEKKYQAFTKKNIYKIPQIDSIPDDIKKAVHVVSEVLPFRTSSYVVDELIDWNNIPDDPIFRLVFPQQGMLSGENFSKLYDLIHKNISEAELIRCILDIRDSMNPHPAGQMELNVPKQKGKFQKGLQHKYNETILFFPSQAQGCHSYCTYCFRWAQFVGIDSLRFASKDVEGLINYINQHPEVTDLLFTGGDPMIMSAKLLKKYIEPVLKRMPGNLKNIRIGTKALTYWPYRFLTDFDSEELIRLFEDIRKSGLNLSLMAHFSHYRELQTEAVKAAVKRIRSTGAQIRCQAPLIRGINDDPAIWRKLWEDQVQLCLIPYYMFIERDTGPKDYFSVPLKKAFEIFTKAYSSVSGLCRTVRGPSMSSTPGKILIDGIVNINGSELFALKFIQARNHEWVNRVFFAEMNEKAIWIDELQPAFGEEKFFFEV